MNTILRRRKEQTKNSEPAFVTGPLVICVMNDLQNEAIMSVADCERLDGQKVAGGAEQSEAEVDGGLISNGFGCRETAGS